MENQQFPVGDAVEDDELADRKAAEAGAEVVIAATSDERIASQERKTVAERLELTISDFAVSALGGSVFPHRCEFGPGRPREAISHLAIVRPGGKQAQSLRLYLLE